MTNSVRITSETLRLPATAFAVVAGLLPLVSCEGANTSAAKSAVARDLIDPESAQYYEVIEDAENGRVCGYVNAKNRLGGYVGKQMFIYETEHRQVHMRTLWTDGAPLTDCIDREFSLAILKLEQSGIDADHITDMYLADGLVCGHAATDDRSRPFVFDVMKNSSVIDGRASAFEMYNALGQCATAASAVAGRGAYYSKWPKSRE